MGQNEPIRGASRAPGAAMRAAAELRTRPAGSPEIPDKLYFRIGDVARICDVPAYVLRFWESEFPQLKPNKGGTGQRLYRRRDVEMALRVRQLLYDEGYTIPGARQLLKAELKQPAPQLSLLGAPATVPDARQMKGLRRELESIVQILSRPVGARPAPQTVRTQRRAGLTAQPPKNGPAAGRGQGHQLLFEQPGD